MSLHNFFVIIPIKERYQFIRQLYQANDNNINQTAIKFGISDKTVKKAINTLDPISRVYERKVKNEHETYIYIHRLFKTCRLQEKN